uniref:Uncharacterized protein n=1 Tax=Setaria italica TaxID=4555 RepID=K3XP77_SETIT
MLIYSCVYICSDPFLVTDTKGERSCNDEVGLLHVETAVMEIFANHGWMSSNRFSV